MKNEVFVKAITEIDDELILSAERSALPKRNALKYLGACAAACFIIVFGIILFSNSNGEPKILFNGAALSSKPVTVMSHDARQAELSVIALPIEIVSKGELTITAEDGMIEVYSSKTNEQLCVGQFCEAEGSVTVEWTIENPDQEQIYKIQINEQKITLILQYEQKSNEWKLLKSED